MILVPLMRWLGHGPRQRRAQNLPGKRSDGGRGSLQLVLRQAHFDVLGFLRSPPGALHDPARHRRQAQPHALHDPDDTPQTRHPRTAGVTTTALAP